jgi:SAM-dependent methyltransferase
MEAAYAQRYRALWDGHWWWRSREALLLAEIDRIGRATPVRRILDVGCGDGLFFDALARFGEVDGLESDASLLRDPRWRDRIAVGRLGAQVRPARSYDLVLMLDVLEHIEDDRAALDSALALTRPGGVLLMTVPALPWLWSRHDEANAHFRRYRPGGLRRRLGRAGFVVESLRFVFAWTVVPMLLRRWLTPAGTGAADHDVAIPPEPINGLLAAWSKAEHALGRVVPWPIGSSLLAVARRPVSSWEGEARAEPGWMLGSAGASPSRERHPRGVKPGAITGARPDAS